VHRRRAPAGTGPESLKACRLSRWTKSRMRWRCRWRVAAMVGAAMGAAAAEPSPVEMVGAMEEVMVAVDRAQD